MTIQEGTPNGTKVYNAENDDDEGNYFVIIMLSICVSIVLLFTTIWVLTCMYKKRDKSVDEQPI